MMWGGRYGGTRGDGPRFRSRTFAPLFCKQCFPGTVPASASFCCDWEYRGRMGTHGPQGPTGREAQLLWVPPPARHPPPPSAWARAGLQQCPRGAPRGAPSGPHSVRGHGGAGHRRASLGISLPAGSHRRAAAVAAGRGGTRAAVPPGAGRTRHWCFLPTGRLAGVAGKKKAGQRRQR